MTAGKFPVTNYSGDRRVLGEFTDADAMLHSLEALHRTGYRKIETFTPFDMPEVDDRIDLPRSRIGWVVAACGLVGLILAYGIQWWANVFNYPLNIGGRPVHAVPAFIFPTFEGTVLLASFGAFFGLLVWLRLPKLWAPIDEVPGFGRASVDRFWVAVGDIKTSQDGDEVEQILRNAGAVHTFPAANV
jgi:hypothetical protein